MTTAVAKYPHAHAASLCQLIDERKPTMLTGAHARTTTKCASCVPVFCDVSFTTGSLDITITPYINSGSLEMDVLTTDITWVATFPEGTIIKTTSDGSASVIPDGPLLTSNEFNIHISPNDYGVLFGDSGDVTGTHSATITTDAGTFVTLSAYITIESETYACFSTDVNIFVRPITTINAVQRDAIKVITEHTTPMITCNNAPQIKPITERTSDIIIIAPCGKRIGA